MEAAEIRGIEAALARGRTKEQMEDDARMVKRVFRELGIDDDD